MALTKSKFVGNLCILIFLQGCSSASPHDFSAEIAECRADKDISGIAQGRYVKGSKMSESGLAFQVEVAHLGTFHGIDMKTGKPTKLIKTTVKKGEAPANALGKEALICISDGQAKAVHLANP